MTTLRNRILLRRLDEFLYHQREVLHHDLEFHFPQLLARLTPAEVIARLRKQGGVYSRNFAYVRVRAQNTGLRQRLTDAGADLTDLNAELTELEGVATALENFSLDESEVAANMAALNATFPRYDFTPAYDPEV